LDDSPPQGVVRLTGNNPQTFPKGHQRWSPNVEDKKESTEKRLDICKTHVRRKYYGLPNDSIQAAIACGVQEMSLYIVHQTTARIINVRI